MNNYLMKILSATSILVLLSACNESAPKPAKVDKSLPKVALNGFLTDMTAAAFEWKPITDARVQGVYVYRNDPESDTPNKLHNIDAVNNRNVTHYLNDELKPETLYYYSFATYNEKGNTSLATKKIAVKTKPLLASVSFFSGAEPMARAAKLIWRPHTNSAVVGYILERRTNGAEGWKKIKNIEGRLNAEYIDTKLKDSTRYEYRLRAVTYNDLISKPSKVVAVLTKALPTAVSQLRATQGKPGYIELSWQDANRANVAYYNIYRSSSKNGSYKLIATKQKGMRYKDQVAEPSKRYFYKVVGVSKDHLEGELKAVTPTVGTTLDAPRPPRNLVAMVENATVQLTWKSTDARTVSFVVIKETEKNFISSETKEFKNIKKSLMIDSSLKPGEAYTFSVVAVDKNGIRSAPSNSVHVKLEDKK